jgi:hypothetical protein
MVSLWDLLQYLFANMDMTQQQFEKVFPGWRGNLESFCDFFFIGEI